MLHSELKEHSSILIKCT